MSKKDTIFFHNLISKWHPIAVTVLYSRSFLASLQASTSSSSDKGEGITQMWIPGGRSVGAVSESCPLQECAVHRSGWAPQMLEQQMQSPRHVWGRAKRLEKNKQKRRWSLESRQGSDSRLYRNFRFQNLKIGCDYGNEENFLGGIWVEEVELSFLVWDCCNSKWYMHSICFCFVLLWFTFNDLSKRHCQIHVNVPYI